MLRLLYDPGSQPILDFMHRREERYWLVGPGRNPQTSYFCPWGSRRPAPLPPGLQSRCLPTRSRRWRVALTRSQLALEPPAAVPGPQVVMTMLASRMAQVTSRRSVDFITAPACALLYCPTGLNEPRQPCSP